MKRKKDLDDWVEKNKPDSYHTTVVEWTENEKKQKIKKIQEILDNALGRMGKQRKNGGNFGSELIDFKYKNLTRQINKEASCVAHVICDVETVE